jgi:hypothetical protein
MGPAKMAMTFALLFLGVSFLQSARPQQDECLQRAVVMNVITRDGQIATSLDPSQFLAFLRHKPVPVLEVMENRRPRRVLILLDASESMKPTHKFTFDVATELLTLLPPGTEVGFQVFAKTVVGSAAMGTDREAVRKQIEGLRDDRRLPTKIKGTTALLSTIQGSLASFGTPRVGDTLYVISDGDDNASNLNWHKLDEEIIQRGVRVFAMRIQWTAEGFEVEGSDNLQDIVNSTGGSSVVVPLDVMRYEDATYDEPMRDSAGKPTQRALQLELQVRLIGNLKRVLIQLPEPTSKARDLELRFSEPKAYKNLVLIYQHSVPPCLASTPADPSSN